MPGPCPVALALSAVPRRRWATRAELLERVDLAKRFIDSHPDANLNVAGLAQIAGLSKSHFVRLFGATYGITPGKYHTQRRLELSLQLLQNGANVNEAAIGCGYDSIPTYCRQFKEHFQKTPSQMRNIG
ncbi:MAG TPA: AraC family transcriptional regulator [Fimbriimonas sp.]|nr:AraC family transcriptional regulator [Fimbriimonas sp.]